MSDAGTTSLIFGVVIGTILCDYALTLLWLARQRRQASGRPLHRRQCPVRCAARAPARARTDGESLLCAPTSGRFCGPRR